VFGTKTVADAAIATRFVAIRFGNVLGSSGSVVPIFSQQIATGGAGNGDARGPMRRYFMTIPAPRRAARR
jgi:FlaA1/EpsC-like NDP-sugar epimerase